jgi:Spy/CpxP family protein refolding chaperone
MNQRIVVPLMLLLGGSPVVAFAHQGGPSPEVRQQIVSQEIDQLAQKLGLDAAGSARFKGTFARYQSELRPLHKDAFETRRALKQELASAQPNQGKVVQLTDQLTSDRDQMRSIQQRRMAELKSQLTPTQYAQLLLSRREVARDLRSKLRAASSSGSGARE